MGIEAFSRGSKKVFLFEKNKEALKCIRQNILNMKDIKVVIGDACLPPVSLECADIIFFDPPYGKGLWQKSLIQFQKNGWIDNQTLIIVETDKLIQEEIPDSFEITRTQSYGRNLFLFLKGK